MAGNHTSVYAPSQASGFNLADTISQQEQLNMQRQEQRRRDEQIQYQRKKEEKALRNQEAKEFWANAKHVELTGVAPVDQLAIGVLEQAMDKHLELYNAVRLGKMDASEAKYLQERLNLIPKRFKAAQQSLMDEVKSTSDAIAKGEIVLTPEIERSLKSVSNGKGSVRLNKDGSFDFIVDIDGDGELDVVSEQEFMSKSWMPDKIKKVDLDKLSSEIAEEVGMAEESWSKGYTDYKTKFPKEGAIDELISSRLSNNDFLKGALYAGGIGDVNFPTPESIDALKTHLKKQVTNRIDTTNEEKYNHSAANSAASLAFQKQQAAEKNAKGQTSKLGDPTIPSEQTWGAKHKEIPEGVKSVPVKDDVKLGVIEGTKEVTKKGGFFSGDKKVEEKVSYQDATLNNYTYDNEGRFFMNISFKDSRIEKGKKVDSWKKANVYGTKETEANVAKSLKISVEELRQRASFTEQNMSTSKSDSSISGNVR